MGVQQDPLACKLINMMKSVAIAALCFFATVAAGGDAESDAHYGYYGHPLAYGLPYAYGYHPYAFGHYYGKRSADAEPAADADADAHLGYYGYPLVAAAAPVVSTVHGGPLHGLSYGGYHLIGKRSA